MFAKFSPDGKWIAFTGQYDGDEQVYVIPATGGVPQAAHLLSRPRAAPAALGLRQPGLRLDAGRQVGLLPLAARRLGLPRRGSTPCRWTGGLGEPLPMPERRRRRPLAGRQEGRLHPVRPRLPHLEALPGRLGPGPLDLRSRDATRRRTITDTPRTERDPMWIGNKIYFDSDRTGTLNLYSYDPASGATAQLTTEHASGTCAGPAPTRTARSSTSWTAS